VTQFSTALLIARFCAMTAIPMLFVVALLLATSHHPVLALLALGILCPLLLVELVSAVILGFTLILFPAARAKFKGELLYPGVHAGVASEDPTVVRLSNVAIAVGAFTIMLMSWLFALNVPTPVWNACGPIAAIALILFWATANARFLMLGRVASLRDVRLAEMVGGRWSDDGRTLVPDYDAVGAYQW
jgi:hypothetical protein